ncbi:MAG: hypothetical protein IT385_11495 [Deltaproteobacteria bacterium]|nr:hypothetical protein [Deltaproteobacteria bacterium]
MPQVSTALLVVACGLLPTRALAHGGDLSDPRVVLHVGDSYESCYFDLHPELKAGELRHFAAEGGQLIRFRQTSGADTLGAGTVDIGVGYQMFFLDDSKGAWNNTMSHPDAEHYLGQELPAPFLTLRFGITDDVDGELYGTLNPLSNYGFVGLAAKIRVLEQDERTPVSIAVRPSVSGLVGPSELQTWNVSIDLSVSRSFGGLTPFLGVAASTTIAAETSDDVDLAVQAAVRPVGFAGVEFAPGRSSSKESPKGGRRRAGGPPRALRPAPRCGGARRRRWAVPARIVPKLDTRGTFC